MSMIQTEPFSLAWQSAPQVAMFGGSCTSSTHSTQCPNCKYNFQCPQLSPGGGGTIQQPVGAHQPTFGGAMPTIGSPQIVTTQVAPFIGGGQQGLVRTQCQMVGAGPCLHNQRGGGSCLHNHIVPCLQNQVTCCQPSQVVFSQTNSVFSQPSQLLVKSSSFSVRPKRTALRSQLSGGGLVPVPTSGDIGDNGSQLSPGLSPQNTPVAQIAFELPTFSVDTEKQRLSAAIDQLILVPVKGPSQPVPEKELQSLASNLMALRQSGWYYEGVSYQESHELLKHTKVGTFLVRNSSDPQFLFTLSVQTDRGPTSVRLHYINGFFKLDSQPHLQTAMRAFPSVIELIEYYVYLFKFRFFRDNKEHVWVDGCGKWYSSIKLEEPLRKREEPPSLKHLARMAIHKSIRSSGKPRIPKLPAPHLQLELPKSLVDYLSEYPHSI